MVQMMREANIVLKITYEQDTDMAYVYLEDINPGEVSMTLTLDEYEEGDINLDFNNSGVLKGIEIANASKVLPASFLAKIQD